MREIVVVSGGFDPIHSGHIKLIKEAAKHGEVVVLLNSDLWLQKKKGKEFLPFIERTIIMNELKNVIDVIEFDLLSPPIPQSNSILFFSQNIDSGVVLLFLSPPFANLIIDFGYLFFTFLRPSMHVLSPSSNSITSITFFNSFIIIVLSIKGRNSLPFFF